MQRICLQFFLPCNPYQDHLHPPTFMEPVLFDNYQANIFWGGEGMGELALVKPRIV